MPRTVDIGQPEGVTVLAPPAGVELAAYKEGIMELVHNGMPYYNASRVVREQFLGVRNEDGTRLRAEPYPSLDFSKNVDDEHTQEKIDRRRYRLVDDGADLPKDPDGKPIRDKAVRDASAKHGDRFWRKADEIFARGGVSKILSRHLAAQEL